MKYILILSLFLSGCAGTAMIGHTANYAISEYCLLLPYGRAILRDELAELLHPNSVEIHCVR